MNQRQATFVMPSCHGCCLIKVIDLNRMALFLTSCWWEGQTNQVYQGRRGSFYVVILVWDFFVHFLFFFKGKQVFICKCLSSRIIWCLHSWGAKHCYAACCFPPYHFSIFRKYMNIHVMQMRVYKSINNCICIIADANFEVKLQSLK